jgi:hypothetical protein
LFTPSDKHETIKQIFEQYNTKKKKEKIPPKNIKKKFLVELANELRSLELSKF